MNDCDIRLNVSDVIEFTEEIKMDNININNPGENKERLAQNTHAEQIQAEQPVNKLFFNPREWTFNKDCKDNVGSRSFMQGPDGTIAEAYTLGDWQWHWTEIVSRTLILPKNTLHTFTFWLNGGENDNNNEICRFEIIYNNDYDNRYTFNLNRNFIKPLKKLNGWELYEIPFITGDNEYTQLKFVAQYAYMTVMTAKDVSAYAELPDTVDEFEDIRPQRHNIVFSDGWPTDEWYSTQKLRNRKSLKKPRIDMKAFEQNNEAACSRFYGVSDSLNAVKSVIGGVTDILNGFSDAVTGTVNAPLGALNAEIRANVEEAVRKCGTANPDDIVDMIMDTMSDRIEQLTDSIADSIEGISDSIETKLDGVESRFDEVQSTFEEMQDAFEEMQDAFEDNED